MKPRKLRVYNVSREWARIRVRMSTKPDSIRLESDTRRAETFFEPVIDLKEKTISGSQMIDPSDFGKLPFDFFNLRIEFNL